jgi:hypothetical protein
MARAKRPSRTVKLTRSYVEFLIQSLRMLNEATEEQVKAFCGKTKQEAMQNVIRGLELSIEPPTQAKP